MKHKIWIAGLAVCMLSACAFGFAACDDKPSGEGEQGESESLTFQINAAGTAYTVTDCETDATNIAIPAEYKTLPVTAIGNDAFNACAVLGKVTIPASVKTIGASAFYNCSALTSVTFAEASEGKALLDIGSSAFRNCTSLAEIALPAAVASIGENAFAGTAYYNDEENWEGDVLYLGGSLLEAKDRVSGVYTVKSGTVLIADGAFQGCASLTGVTVPDSVTSVGENAFADTGYYNNEESWDDDGVLYSGKHLIKAKSTVPETYTVKEGTLVIADGAFADCAELTAVIIPEGLVSIGAGAFGGCTVFMGIVIPASVKSVGSGAFAGCADLTNVLYRGTTETQWKEIALGTDNSALTSATVYYYSETQPTGEGNYWYEAEGGPTPWGEM